MNRWYILAGLVLVAIVSGLLLWQKTGINQRAAPWFPNKQTPTTSILPTMKSKQYSSPPPMTIDAHKTYVATVNTDKGTMRIVLYAKETPVTVNNFVFLAREGFYNNTIFHRVIKGFMIQGGDPLGNGTGSPGYTFSDEKITGDYTRGTIAMANSGPNTNGSQFFIMHADYALPKNYVIFGAIDPKDSTSFATLDAIATQTVVDSGTGEVSKPVTPTVVRTVTIEEK